MFGLDMLDVVIGVIFVYLLLSLICSAVNEMIEAFMKQRAYSLENGIRELLVQDSEAIKQARIEFEKAKNNKELATAKSLLLMMPLKMQKPNSKRLQEIL